MGKSGPVAESVPGGSRDVRPPRPGARAKPSDSSVSQDAVVIAELPNAALTEPVTHTLDLTPSPIPRASLTPPTGLADLRQPRPISAPERNAPTVAARHLPLQGRVRHAPAVTAPPLTRMPGESHVARKLVQDVRSSKREITYGLVIGVALSVLLGVFAKGYLERPYVDPRAAARDVEPNASVRAVAEATDVGEHLDRASEASYAPTQGAPLIAEPFAAEPFPAEAAPSERSALATRMSESLAALDVEAARAEGAPRARGKLSSRRHPGTRGARSRAATPSPAAEALEPESSRGPAALSPSESAGLGLELPL